MEKIAPERMRPIRDEVYEMIRKAIMRGDYKPGERLQEGKLAKQLGVSRTPLREAMRKLEEDRMVIHYPHRGAVVAEVFVDEMEELYEIRTLVESFLAKYAALNATREDVARLYALLEQEESAKDPNAIGDAIDAYNAAIAEISDRPGIANIGRRVRETLSRMILSSHLNEERRPSAQREHREIVDAIAAGDGQLAQSLTIRHLKNASRVLRPGLQAQESGDEE